MKRGYFRHYRKLEDWPWRNKPNYFSVWMRCLERATHEDYKTRRGNEPIILKPGQFVCGLHQLAKETGVKMTSVNYILDVLELENQIEMDSNPQGTVITVLNWEEYQAVENVVDTKLKTDGKQNETTQEHIHNRSKTNARYPEEFLDFWNVYPLKKGKGQALRAWKSATNKRPSIKELIEIIKKQKTWPEFNEYTPYASTWLNGDRWEDEPKQKTSGRHKFRGLD